MTATDELRAELTKRGVEWEDMSARFPTGMLWCTSWTSQDGEPCTALEGADDIPDGKLSVQALLTPAQAIAATLGDVPCLPHFWTADGTLHVEPCRMPERVQAHLGGEDVTFERGLGTCKEVYLLMATDIGDGREEVLGAYATESAATKEISENQFGYALHHVRKLEVTS